MNSDREGPQEQVIPGMRMKTCWGCKHHYNRMIVHRFVGPSEYEDRCNHPDAYEEKSPLLKFPRRIGHGDSSETPDWCPFLRAEK